ncbi:MAG: histidine triad nucleotide-binding protein [Gemmatimonadetes bacterium]|nr:histidine triad nucleotide-binding protein [Gemmatimonadota bacterium]
MTDCLFCRIVRGEIPAAKVAETDECLAFRDIAPQAPVHVLIIPRKHFGSLDEVPDASVVGAMSMLAQQVARSEGIAAAGYRCVINTGAHGGQTVGHLHMHLLGGRAHGWPPG